MTLKEFQAWLDSFCKTFPDTGKWIDGRPNIKQLTDEWYQNSFSKIDIRDARGVISRLISGDLPKWLFGWSGHEHCARTNDDYT